MVVATLLLVLFPLLIFYIYIQLKVPRNFPPGPYLPLPVLRRVPWSQFYGLNTIQALDIIRRECGDTFSAHIGHRRIVMMSEYDTIKEIFAKKVIRRPTEIINHWRDGRYGVIFTNGDDWKAQSKLFLEALKSTRFGKDVIQNSIELIWPKMKSIIENNENVITSKSFDLPLLEFLMVSFCDPSVLPGGKFSKADLDCLMIARYSGIQWCEFELWYRFPILRSLVPNWSGYASALDALQKGYRILEEIVRLHEEKPSEYRNDFIDAYLRKMKKIKETGDPSSVLYGGSGKKCMIAALDNILLGGDGLFIAINAIFYILARYPEVQEQLREELENIIPYGQDMSLDMDKKSLIYAQAFQMEVQRFIAQSGYGAPHHVDEQVNVDGWSIPPKVDVYCNMYHVLRDPEHWDDPEAFKPERFIDEDTGKIKTPPQWIPFEIGPRMCPGRKFALDALIALTSKTVMEYKIKYGGRIVEARKGEIEKTTPTFGMDKYKIQSGDEDVMDLVGMSLIQPKPFALKFEKLNKECNSVTHTQTETVLKDIDEKNHFEKEFDVSTRFHYGDLRFSR